MSTVRHLKLNEQNKVLRVELHRPDRRNAFHPEMIQELTTLFAELDARDDLRAVVLSGAGKSFSAGGDLEWMRSMVNYSREENLKDAQALFEMFLKMSECSLPLIGVVHGHVMGGGLGLVSVCDLVVAEEATLFSFSEVRIGIAPAVISPFVKRKANWGAVRPWMMNGGVFSAAEAERCGLVHVVADSSDLEKILNEKVKSFFEGGPQAVRAAKKLLWSLESQSLLAVRDTCAELIADRRASAEGQEGLKAFLEKREPQWRGEKVKP